MDNKEENLQESSIAAEGTLVIEVTDEHGNVKDRRELTNLVVTVGKAHIVSRMQGVAQAAMGWIAVGTDATAADAANTALGAEAGRVAASPTIVTTDTANDTSQLIAVFPAGTATGALVEAAVLNAASAGTLLSRVTFAVVNKGALDGMTITWQVKIS